MEKEMEEEQKQKKREREKRKTVDSLGWLTESTIMPKKVKAIEGVGASSIMELKAQLYRSQEESKKSRDPDLEYQRAKTVVPAPDHFSRRNSGVEARSHKDKLAFKAEKDGSASYAALEKKAKLYDKLVRGELPDEEDEEKYCVDFFRKGLLQDELPDNEAQHNTTTEPSQQDDEDDSFVPFSQKPFSLGRTAGNADRDEHKRFVREVHEEASEAREKVSELKLRRVEQAVSRREKLKQAYLRKRLENLKATSKAEQSQQRSSP